MKGELYMGYLERFRGELERRWPGRLVRVREAQDIEPRAKEYLARLARDGMIERVTWGWYWIPATLNGFLEFVSRQECVVLQKQTAAGVWNGDFVHRESYTVAVRDSSYARALSAFARSRRWQVTVETRAFRAGDYVKIGEFWVESLEETIVDCVKSWAFADALAALYAHYDAIRWARVSRHDWERIPRTNVRVGQVVKYGAALMGQEIGDDRLPATRARISDLFVRRQVDEAAHQVASVA